MALRFHHRIETALPVQSSDGVVEIKGWCLLEGATVAPQVKLISGHGEIPLLSRTLRPDVGSAFGISNETLPWGFELRGKLPAGVHRLTLFAAAAGSNEWQPLRCFTAVVLSRGLQAAIEFPSDATVRESVRLQGWAAHPEKAIREVWLHYGTRRVRCEFGLPREDVPKFLPHAPGAAKSGFITAKNAPAGRGSIRVVAVDSQATRHVARTNCFADINRDEENPHGLNLPAALARVSPTRRISRDSAQEVTAFGRRLRVLFVLYGDFTSNSAIHVAALANAMVAAGHECVVAVPENAETISHHRGARFRAVRFDAIPTDGTIFSEHRAPDIIHGWTTRENVRQRCESLHRTTGAQLVVHLEDNELRILELSAGRSADELLSLPRDELDRLVPPTLSHPQLSKAFLASAAGVTVITEKLRELVPPGPKVHEFWPAADADSYFPRPIPREFRAALGFDDNHTLLFYHGNVHAANQAEVRELYLAVARLNDEGIPTTLLRTGRDFCDFLGTDNERCTRHVLAIGQIQQHHHLPPLMALADFFVQPGKADAFNDYRFPSKLPEFFALGRPVILPLTNLGAWVRDGQDAYVLEQADAAGIAGAVRRLKAEPPLRERLSAGASAFAERRFSWQRAAEGLLNFYSQLTASDIAAKVTLHVRNPAPP